MLDVKTGAEPADETIIVQGEIIVDMKPLTAIQTGTINAADLMGWTHKVGTLDAGKRTE